MDDPTGFHLDIDGEFYSAGMSDYVAVPVTDGEHFTLYTDDGDIVSNVSRHADSGRYTIDADAGGDPGDIILYRDWQAAIVAEAERGSCSGDLDAIKRTVNER